MGEQYYAEVKAFPTSYAPLQWAYCEGQLVPVDQNRALYNLLGISFGGNGRSTFALPDLRGRVAVGQDKGLMTENREFGKPFGQKTVELTEENLPEHYHQLYALKETSKRSKPDAESYPAKAKDSTLGTVISAYKQYSDIKGFTIMNENVLESSGGVMPHYNYQPFLTLNYFIAIDGVYPAMALQ